MKIRTSLTLIALAALTLTAFVLSPSSSSAKIEKGATRPLMTKHLMSGVVKPFGGELRKAIAAAGSEEKAWEDVVKFAGLLNEASHVLMADKRCPDKVWADACKIMETRTLEVLAAAKKKDAAAAAAAAKGIGKSCGTCHKAHKG